MKRVTAAIMGDPPTLSNDVNTGAAGGTTPGLMELEALLNVGFVAVDQEGHLQPQLAEAVPTVENRLWQVLPDGRMETTWKIRPSARWQDGASFLAEDVLFTVGVVQDRELAAIFAQRAFDLVERVEARDSQTVVVHWKQPYIAADTIFSSKRPFLPKHLLESPHTNNKATFTALPYWASEYVGTGPYGLRQWIAGSHVVLQANSQYVLGRPKIDEIEVRFIPDPAALMANILAGVVELTLGRALSLEQGMQIASQWRDGKMDIAPVNWMAIFPQFVTPSPPAIADERLRRALLMAIDRQEMAESIVAGLGSVAHSYLNPNEPDYRAIENQVVRYDYDLRGAVQAIDGLGYARGPDGVFRDAANQKLAVELRTTKEDIHERSLFPVADYWQRLGVEVEPVVVPPQRLRDREYRATYPGFELVQQPNDTARLETYRGAASPLPENDFVGNNRARYRNAEFDTLIDSFFVTIPREPRTEILGKIIHHISDQLVAMGLFYNAQPTMIGNRLQQVSSIQVGAANRVWNAHEWDLR